MLIAVAAALLTLTLDPNLAVAQAKGAAAAQATKADALARVAIIGASVSDGVGAAPGWQAAFAASLARESKCVVDEASVMFFMDPRHHSTRQVDAALAAEPTLVLAVDFLFWFGYGTQDFEGGTIQSEEAREALLEQGLALLEKFECPLVVGDFPDMTPAVGIMLQPRQMPQTATLTKLNARVAAWAKDKKNVVLLSVAAWMDELHAHKALKIGAQSYEPAVTERWMQADKLHPTAEGLAALATLVDVQLEARKLVAKKDCIADVAKVLERMHKQAAEAVAPAGGK